MEEGKNQTAEQEEHEEKEETKLRRMRSLVETEDCSSKDVDDQTLRRFLRARDSDIEKGSRMFLKYLKWRKTFVPTGSVSILDIPNEIAHNKCFVQGEDKFGGPVLVVLGNKHFQNKNGVDELKKYVVYLLDKTCQRIRPGQEKFTAIADFQGWGYANSDIRGYIAALSILQDYYPERLGKLFMVHAPRIFMKMWKCVCPFIDENTKKKITFVENKTLKSTLLEVIDETQLPEIYGGKLPLVPIQDC